MDLPQRKLPRLAHYDYATPNYYFITICTQEKRHLFGDAGKLNRYGEIAEQELLNIPAHFVGVKIDKHAVMPNHVHAIVVIGGDEAERSRPFPTLSTVVGLYKSGVSQRIHQMKPGVAVWQKSFHDHVIRGWEDYAEIWTYIEENPQRWELDSFYGHS